MPKKKFTGFSDFERSAMKERILELKAESERADGTKAVKAAIAKMSPADQVMAKKLHALVLKHAPSLKPKTWYSMPAYANKEDKVVCFFQEARKFKTRYSTFGFQDAAKLDDGVMWATAFAVKKIGPAQERKIALLIKKAIT